MEVKCVYKSVSIELGKNVHVIRAVKNSNLHMETEFLSYCPRNVHSTTPKCMIL